MSNTLRKARILSSENDASVKQEQSTNVNIKITPNKSTNLQYPQIPQLNSNTNNSNINFTQENQSTYQSKQAINKNQEVERSIVDLSYELDSLEKKNRFLEMIVAMYETNPLKINSYVVCDSKLLMNMIKLLTDAEKVEIVLDESEVGCGCSMSNNKFMKIDKILVYKNNKTEDLKYGYNEIYTQFIRYGVSLKIVS